ncbi:glycosyltransferase involved in cell wall biosynthesis [Arthrobacter sp. UYCu512]|uniref:glycosyltransferase n=1 Tax=Arthrobacter sp. UYCu512 TaxID=3156338 RepID=UPI0033924D1F
MMKANAAREANEIKLDIDYGPRMFTDAKARADEIDELSRTSSLEPLWVNDCDAGWRPGVTVVIPSYRGADRIGTCLQSLLDQDLDARSFEVVLVINGVDDGTLGIAQAFSQNYPEHSLRILFQSQPSAGAARNLGIAAAAFEYLTFVDDDDYVGPSFLSGLIKVASQSCVAISPIVNVQPDGVEDSDSPLNAQILSRSTSKFKLIEASSIIGFNACKLFPTAALSTVRYVDELQSGEDVCFMAAVATQNDFDALVSTKDRAGAYFRTLRDESISRQPLTYNFAIEQRLAVIRVLESQRSWDGSANDNLLSTLIRSQAGFTRRYLDEHPEEREEIIASVDEFEVKDFPWSLLNKGIAKDLVVSYCFAPYSDTSATVASKAIVERGLIVDVIHNNMGKVRRKDANLGTIAGRLIDKTVEIDAPPSFAGWKQISEFVSKGISVADRQDAIAGGYRTLYSRVLWPGSHFLAALFKLRHSTVRWTAEFSDPLSHDVMGLKRAGDLERDDMFEVFNRGVLSRGFAAPKTDSLFIWCEFITYVLADEIIFTNENQLAYMLSHISDRKLRRHVAEKAVVRVHPTPPARSYELLPSDYPLSNSVINIGYFGAFYENRGLMEVLTALVNSPSEVRKRTRLHVFTNKAEELALTVQRLGLTGVVKSQGYRPYLEFLNLVTRFDVLLVNDVERAGELQINPFLPSKYSDYLGAGRPIWGVVDEGSPLSGKPLEYKSAVGNGVEAVAVLNRIHTDWAPNL